MYYPDAFKEATLPLSGSPLNHGIAPFCSTGLKLWDFQKIQTEVGGLRPDSNCGNGLQIIWSLFQTKKTERRWMRHGMGPSGNGGRNKRHRRGATHGGRHLQLLVESEAMVYYLLHSKTNRGDLLYEAKKAWVALLFVRKETICYVSAWNSSALLLNNLFFGTPVCSKKNGLASRPFSCHASPKIIRRRIREAKNEIFVLKISEKGWE